MNNYTTYDEFVENAKNEKPEMWEDIEFHSKIIAQIISARTKKGISQAELAEMCGLKQSAIARIEACKCVPKINTLKKILEPLDLELIVRPKIDSSMTVFKVICNKSEVSKNRLVLNHGQNQWEKIYIPLKDINEVLVG